MTGTLEIKSHRKPRGQGFARRAEILDAAKRLFVTEGFEHTTIRKIAAAIGVSAATLYVYFPDKDSILQAIAESAFENLTVRLMASQQSDATELERFRAGLAAYVGFGLAYPDEYRLTFLAKTVTPAAPGRTAVPCDDVAEAGRSFASLVASIQSLMQQGIFAPADPELTAEVVWGSLHGLTLLMLDQCGNLSSDLAALERRTLDMVIKGLLA
jgi:AcrR family transcriptional regulator